MSTKYETFPSVSKLTRYIRRGKNVLLMGGHGVGKTSLIMKAFQEAFGEINKDFIMLNGATLDPWINLIGIPTIKTLEDGREVTRIVPPEHISIHLRAIFIDEINRAPKAAQNALMDLIHTGSINGRKFESLEVVFAAINPDPETYSVEEMDPAQMDRFPVQIALPYMPNKDYFDGKWGEETSKAARDWWTTLSGDQQKLCSPRRLDDCVEAILEGDDLRDYLPHSVKHDVLKAKVQSAQKNMALVTLVGGFSEEEIAGYFTIDKLIKNASALESDVAFFTSKIAPHLSETTREAMALERKTLPGCVGALYASGHLVREGNGVVLMSHAISDMKTKITGSGKQANTRNYNQFVDVLLCDQVLEAAEPYLGKEARALVNTSGSKDRVIKSMNGWVEATKLLGTIFEKTGMIAYLIRDQKVAEVGVHQLFTFIGRLTTNDFKNYIMSSSKNDKAMIEIIAVGVNLWLMKEKIEDFGAEAAQAIGRNSAGSYHYFEAKLFSTIQDAIKKILRSSDLQKYLEESMGVEYEHIKAAYGLIGYSKPRLERGTDEFHVVDEMNLLSERFEA